jgi:aryl-alcohol dehydrogenase-like predicted oxidoreductase
MEYRTLGRSGVQVGALALGTMMFGRGGNPDEAACARMVHQSLDAGINLFDSADGYGMGDSERILGAALVASGRRDQAIVATKCYFPRRRFSGDDDKTRRGGSRRWIVHACDESLRRLGLDHIDLYQLHRLDPHADWDESLGALTDLVRAGKVRMIGTSGTAAWQQVELARLASTRGHVAPVSEQPPYSIFTRSIERALLPTCERYGVGVLCYGPLNGGWLTGKYRRDATPDEGTRASRSFFSKAWWDRSRDEVQRKFDVLEALERVAADAGVPLLRVALAFTLAHPGVSAAIIGPRTEAQLLDLLTGVDFRLGADALDAIDALVAPGTDLDATDFLVVDRALDPALRRRVAHSS